MIRIAPSILAADFADLKTDLARIEIAGADLVHLDIMDGHFVPNITFGPQVVEAVRRATDLPLEAHLMLSEPGLFLTEFAAAGADIISFHAEATCHAHRLIGQIRNLGKSPGIVLNPATPPEMIYYVLDFVDMVTVMTVNPGFGGQTFIPELIPKIALLAAEIERRHLDVAIQVDGGIGPQTAGKVIEAGARVLVAGSAIFGSSDPKSVMNAMRDAKEGDIP